MKNPSMSSRPRSNADERARIISLYQSSGLSQRKFAEEHGVSLSTLQQWIYRQQRERARVGKSKESVVPLEFGEVKLAGPPTAWAMEVVSPGGLTLRCREPLPVKAVVRLLRGKGC